jgi:nitric oxide reductase large subunit
MFDGEVKQLILNKHHSLSSGLAKSLTFSATHDVFEKAIALSDTATNSINDIVLTSHSFTASCDLSKSNLLSVPETTLPYFTPDSTEAADLLATSTFSAYFSSKTLSHPAAVSLMVTDSDFSDSTRRLTSSLTRSDGNSTTMYVGIVGDVQTSEEKSWSFVAVVIVLMLVCCVCFGFLIYKEHKRKMLKSEKKQKEEKAKGPSKAK